MPDILHEVTISAAPDMVFKAITESQGLEAWWATHAIAEPTIGSAVQVRFGDDPFVNEMKVTALEPGRKVEWIALQSMLPEWIDTHITWDLVPVENGTKLLFGQRGYASPDGCMAMCSYHWAAYLTSLKSYLETHKGNPNSI